MKTMNGRVLLLCLVAVLSLSALTVLAITSIKQNDSEVATVFVSPSSVNAKVNQTFMIGISASEVSDLYGWEFKLGYDTTLLELVNVAEGSFLNSSRDTYFVPKVMSTDGYILAGCTSLRNVSGVNGNGTLATVEFRAKTLGSCTLDLYDTKLVNSAKQLVEHSEVDGIVTASGCMIIRVQYLDGSPRSGADVQTYDGTMYIGRTNESGQIDCSFLSPGGYTIRAYYPPGGPQFGSDTALIIPGNATITGNWEITPPVISLISPQNQTYDGRLVPLNFTIYDYSPISWMGYSLDGQANATVTGNVTLNVDKGSHSVVVYANDTYGNMGSSDVVYFSSSGGCVVVTVNYMDGYPRSGANVWIYSPMNKEIGTTGEDGKVTDCNLGLSEGTYWIRAYWPSGTQFGSHTELPVDSNGDGTATIQRNIEITPPAIEILSPQNLTYTNSSVPLAFTIYDYSAISWIGYSLDNQSNTTITGNTTLTVEDGTHRIVVYANDSFGNMGCSQIVHFTIGEHDIAVANITVPKTIVGQAYSTSIQVIVENQGDRTETFNVTLYANTTIVQTITNISLTSGNSSTITFTWNTTGFAKGNYTISAYASPVQNETDTTNNNCTDGWVLITKVGDLGSRVLVGGTYTNEFGVSDNLVTSTDLSLFLQCYKATAPPAYMYLGDLGSRVNVGGTYTNVFFACDGAVTSTDLSLFLQCYKGQGPPDP